jgi:peptidoglycan/xylan/chitin deacetylase (PgdA/CDA1 family)
MRDGAIVLLHDVQPYPHPTPEALDILIPELLAQGYELVTLSELFARKGVTPDPREEIMWTYVE